MIVILVPIFLFSLIAFLNGFWGPYLRKSKTSNVNPKVSILIPAKNEINRIHKCLDTIFDQDYTNYEVLVLDDESTDGTYQFINSKYNDKLRLIKGKKRPDGWLGKNWACKQLADNANGDYFIFTDADNWYSKDSISKTVSTFTKYNLDLLSCFPENITITFHEKIFSGVVEHILYSLLPLWLTLKSRKSSLAAANGQWLAFKAKSYTKLGGHDAVKSTNVEDIALARLAKKKGMKILTLSGIGVVFTRMYTNFSEIENGFSKNMYQMLGGNIPAFLLNIVLFWCTLLSNFVNNPFVLTLSLALLIIWKAILSYKYKLNFVLILLFHPLIVLFISYIGIKSIFKQNKKIVWR